MPARDRVDGPPAAWTEAVHHLRTATLRPEVVCEPMPAPQRIAPYSTALTGDVVRAGDEVGTGRLVLLHDPDGNDAWRGTFRLVTYARADVDPEMVADPMLAAVGWSWLTEALESHGVQHAALGGTVTTVHSEGFDAMAEDGSTAQLEIRASWTPDSALADHVTAWGDLLCTVAGLPPLAPGVVAMPNRRRRS